MGLAEDELLAAVAGLYLADDAAARCEPDRAAQFQVAIDEYDKIPQMLQEFMGTIEGLGPNPFKGF